MYLNETGTTKSHVDISIVVFNSCKRQRSYANPGISWHSPNIACSVDLCGYNLSEIKTISDIYDKIHIHDVFQWLNCTRGKQFNIIFHQLSTCSLTCLN